MVIVSREPGAADAEVAGRRAQAELKRGVRADPLVQAVLDRFPGAEIVGVRRATPRPNRRRTMPDDRRDPTTRRQRRRSR